MDDSWVHHWVEPKAAMKEQRSVATMATLTVAEWVAVRVGVTAQRMADHSVAPRAALRVFHWAARSESQKAVPSAALWVATRVVQTVDRKDDYLVALTVWPTAAQMVALSAASWAVRKAVRRAIPTADQRVAVRAANLAEH